MRNVIKKVLVFLCGVCLAAGFSACGQTAGYQDTYYATYGEWFALPKAESVCVTNAQGENVSIKDGKFYVDKSGTYRAVFTQNGKEYVSSVVVNVPAPTIVVEKSVTYAKVGEEVQLPAAQAYDAVGKIDCNSKVYYGEEEIDIQNGFTPTAVGTYRYELTAISHGKTTVRNVDVYVEPTSDYQNVITSWDKPYGVNQIGFLWDNAKSYSSEVKLEGEDGSLQLKAAPKYYSQGCCEAILQNLVQANIGQYEAIYFYVYNDTNEKYTMYWGWSNSTLLTPKAWTLCILEKEDYASAINSHYANGKNSVSTENFNGMLINFTYPNKDMFVTDSECLYLSAMYGVEKKSAAEVQSQIHAALQSEPFSQKTAELAKMNYQLLSLKDKDSISGYVELVNRIDENYMKANGTTPEKDKVMYFDKEIGLLQFREPWGQSTYEITDEKTYRGEKVLKATKTGIEMMLEFTRPLLYDLSAYEYLTFGIYNGAAETLLFDNGSGGKAHLLGKSTLISLPAGQWTTINLPLDTVTDVVDGWLWIRHPKWQSIDYEYSIYISPIYASQNPVENPQTALLKSNEKLAKMHMEFDTFVEEKQNKGKVRK